MKQNNYLLKIFLFFLCFSLIAYYPSSYIIKADTGYNTLYKFDNVGAGVSSGTENYGSWSVDIDAYGFTSTDYDFSPPNSLKLNIGHQPSVIAYFNLTNGEIMNGCKVGLYLNGAGQSNIYVVFYDDLGQEIVKFRFSAYNVQNSCYAVYDYASTSYKTLLAYTGGGIDKIYQQYTYFGFQNNFTEGVSPINYVYYYLENSTGSIICDDEYSYNSDYQYIGGSVTVKKIKIINSGYTGNDNYVYFDDFKITAEDFGGETDLTGYLEYCEGAIYHHANIEYPYLSSYTNIPFTGTIQYLDLWVNTLQLALISDTLTDYSACINGVSIGHPSQIVNQIGAEYSLRWSNIDRTFNGQYLNIQFYSADHYTIGGHSYYWYNLPYGDKIGNSGIGTHNNSEYYCRNMYTYHVEISGDLRLCLYYEYPQPPPPDVTCDFIDSLTLTFPYGHYIYDAVFVNWYVNSMVDTYIKVYYNDVLQESHDAYACLGDFEYTPPSEGVYKVEINRSGVDQYSEEFWVSDNVSPTFNNSQLWSNKYRIDSGETFRLNWLYNKTYYNNTDGFICWGRQSALNPLDYVLRSLKQDIEGNNIYEGITSNDFIESGDYWFFLGYIRGQNDFVKLKQIKITVKGETTTKNDIWTDKWIYDQEFNPLHGRYMAEVIISGYHTHEGQTVKIDINYGDTVIPVSYSPFNKYFYTREGNYFVRLILIDNGVTTELANCSFYVNALGGTTPTDDLGWDFWTLLAQIPSGFALILGFMVTFLFALAPLGIAHIFNMQEIPAIMYIISTCIGLTLSVALGWLPFWIPFFIVVIAIIYIFIEWWRNNPTFGGFGGG